jgi:hypothetical protein
MNDVACYNIVIDNNSVHVLVTTKTIITAYFDGFGKDWCKRQHDCIEFTGHDRINKSFLWTWKRVKRGFSGWYSFYSFAEFMYWKCARKSWIILRVAFIANAFIRKPFIHNTHTHITVVGCYCIIWCDKI